MHQYKLAALAGRRIDAAGTDAARFPLRNAELVRHRLNAIFHAEDIGTLVCSAACGADLLALDEGGRLGIRRRVVLPVDVTRFRETSVVDRPGPWGEMYDRIIAAVGAVGDLVILSGAPSDATAYEQATQTIIEQALELSLSGSMNDDGAARSAPLAITVWEGAARGPTDATESFRRKAAERGFDLRTVLTC